MGARSEDRAIYIYNLRREQNDYKKNKVKLAMHK